MKHVTFLCWTSDWDSKASLSSEPGSGQGWLGVIPWWCWSSGLLFTPRPTEPGRRLRLRTTQTVLSRMKTASLTGISTAWIAYGPSETPSEGSGLSLFTQQLWGRTFWSFFYASYLSLMLPKCQRPVQNREGGSGQRLPESSFLFFNDLIFLFRVHWCLPPFVSVWRCQSLWNGS